MSEKTREIEPEKAKASDPGQDALPDLDNLEEEVVDFQEPALPIDDVDEFLSTDSLEEEGEPDDDALSREEQDLAELVKEEPLDLLDDPVLMMELSEDPVRLYLKEIGGIDLLDSNQEFWLSTQMDAARRVEILARQHPLVRKGDSLPRNVYRALYEDLGTSWKRVIEDSRRFGFDAPELSLMLGEAQMLRHTWAADIPSYVHAYLDNGKWGRDPLWDNVARYVITGYNCFYLLPEELAGYLATHLQENTKLPTESDFLGHMPPDRSEEHTSELQSQ